MSISRRRTRQRAETCPVAAAWDAGHEPPPEAFQHEHRDTLIGAIYFRWAERKPSWQGHHPHLRDWLAALRSLA